MKIVMTKSKVIELCEEKIKLLKEKLLYIGEQDIRDEAARLEKLNKFWNKYSFGLIKLYTKDAILDIAKQTFTNQYFLLLPPQKVWLMNRCSLIEKMCDAAKANIIDTVELSIEDYDLIKRQN